MALSNMQVFNDYIMPATVETLAQRVALFNEASNGAIRLTTDGFTGDFLQESFFKGLGAAQRRVDRYAANNTASVTDLTEQARNAVKVAGGIGPILYEPSQLTWLQRPTAQGIAVISGQFADLILKDQINTAIAALAAAIGNEADAAHDVSASSGLSYLALNGAHAKFGDASGNLVADVMNGAAYHKLIAGNLTNAAQLFQAGNVRVVDILGKTTVVTDAPALTDGTKLRVLSLADSAAVVSDGSDMVANVQTSNGKQRIETTMQVDYSYGLSLKGYSWDTSNGGKSPDDSELATGANWVRAAGSVKDTAGVLTVADGNQ